MNLSVVISVSNKFHKKLIRFEKDNHDRNSDINLNQLANYI